MCTDQTKPSRTTRLWLWLELTILYVIVPPALAGFIQPERGDAVLRSVGITGWSFDVGAPRGVFVFPVLLVTFLSMFLYLRLDPTFDNTRLWNRAALRSDSRRIVAIFIPSAIAILGITYLLAYHTPLLPESGFLRLPREFPIIIVFITIFYPWVSAYPQEITHRAFFFHRYRSIIGEGHAAFWLNVVTFSWLHVTMWNWIALAMTVPAGILFAYTYRRTNSALATGFEHAIYGIWAFFCGLGYFVFTGNANGV
jgi:hypothetical protein